MPAKTIDGGHMLRCTVTGRMTGRKRAFSEEVFIEQDANKFPASKIASEIAKVWKMSQAEERLMLRPGKTLSITIRLTPRKV